jgi:hypothetical protein
MRTLWGAVTEISDIGVVAEHCPYCQRLVSCLLRCVCRGNYVLFLKITAPLLDNSCLCTGCLKAFPGQRYWRYAAVVPIQEAKALPMDVLLTRTNPVLAERIEFKDQLCALGGDNQFAAAYEQLETLRPGALRSRLLRQLLDWDRLDQKQRAALGEQISALARAWQFARQVAPGFPRPAGYVPVAMALVVGLAFVLVPAIRSWLWGTGTVLGGVIAATLFNHLVVKRWVSRWTRTVLLPDAQDANVSLDSFVAVVDDVPGCRLGLTEDLWPMKHQLEKIRSVLLAEGKLQNENTQIQVRDLVAH